MTEGEQLIWRAVQRQGHAHADGSVDVIRLSWAEAARDCGVTREWLMAAARRMIHTAQLRWIPEYVRLSPDGQILGMHMLLRATTERERADFERIRRLA